MTENAEDTTLDGIAAQDMLSGLTRQRASQFVIKTIPKKRRDEYVDDGWSVAKVNKKSIRMRRPKKHDVLFEDRVWTVMAKIGFPYLNEDRQFKIRCSKNPNISPKQIDVFAADDESAMIVECKSAESTVSKSLQKDIGHLSDMKKGIHRTVNEHFGKKMRIGWIIATRNIRVSKPDLARMSEANISHLSIDDVEYFEQLADHLGPVARYQLCGKIFENQEIPNLPNKVPAIRGTIGKTRFYAFLAPPELILRIGFVLHRMESSKSAFDSYQRLVKKTRLVEIGKYIESGGGFFPNSIILNINSKRALRFDIAGCAQHDSNAAVGVLHLPKQYKSAFIIDGQHRLFGYGRTDKRRTHSIPFVAFESLPARDQTEMFVTINSKQKSVATNLLMQLKAEFDWDSSDTDAAVGSLQTKFIERLNRDVSSVLYRRIKLGEEKGDDKKCLTLFYLRAQGVRRTGFFGKVENRKLVKAGYFQGSSYENTLENTYCFVNACLANVQEAIPDMWDLGKAKGGLVTMNVGMSALIRVIDDILQHLEQKKGEVINASKAETLQPKVASYLIHVAQFLGSLSQDDIEQMRAFGGGSAVDKVLMEYRNAVNQERSDFEPAGLKKWQDESTGKYNHLTKEIIDRVEIEVRKHILIGLKKAYGEKDRNWWDMGVPIKIRTKCDEIREDQGYKEVHENYLSVLDYYEIVKRKENRSFLLKALSPPGSDSTKEEKRIAWIKKWSDIRNKISHPARDKVTVEEYEYMQDIERWLRPSLGY